MNDGDDESADGPEDATDEPGGRDHADDGDASATDAESEPTPEEPEASEEATESDEPADAASEIEAIVERFDARLDEVEADLETAETEADLDEVEADLDAVEADVEETELPEPEADDEAESEGEDGDEEEEDPLEEVEDRIDDLRADLEDARGPYAEDVQNAANGSAATIRNTRWTEEGEPDVRAAVEAFLGAAGEQFEVTFEPDGDELDDHAAAVETVGEAAVEGGETNPDGFHPDDDAATIAALLEAIDELDADLEDAHEWDDLTVAEQLRREGFYDRLVAENHKDFPPERNVVRIAEQEGDAERILMALDHLDSDFVEQNCIDALKRLGAEEAFDEMHQRAQRRKVGPIEVLGKIGDDRAVETLAEFVDGNNVPVQRASIRALGEIGSEDATQAVANALADDDPDVRSRAARALGLIGDPRAVDPLVDRLDQNDEDGSVRAAAAWALVQIGTERALEAAAEFADDRSYIVAVEAEKAHEAIEVESTTTA